MQDETKCEKKPPRAPCCSKKKAMMMGAAMCLIMFALAVYFDLY